MSHFPLSSLVGIPLHLKPKEFGNVTHTYLVEPAVHQVLNQVDQMEAFSERHQADPHNPANAPPSVAAAQAHSNSAGMRDTAPHHVHCTMIFNAPIPPRNIERTKILLPAGSSNHASIGLKQRRGFDMNCKQATGAMIKESTAQATEVDEQKMPARDDKISTRQGAIDLSNETHEHETSTSGGLFDANMLDQLTFVVQQVVEKVGAKKNKDALTRYWF